MDYGKRRQMDEGVNLREKSARFRKREICENEIRQKKSSGDKAP